jgi:NAD(P)-dependent dehydrogenase (short-subunit alcohol dehydrogenase family)
MMEEKNFSGRFFTVACDLTNETEILNSFKWIDENIGGIHFMINNAGIVRISKLIGKIIITIKREKNYFFCYISNSIISVSTFLTSPLDRRFAVKQSPIYYLSHLMGHHKYFLSPFQFKT